MELSVEFQEIDDLAKQIDRESKKWPKYRKEALAKIGPEARDVAKSYAPISPKKSQYETTLQDFTTTRPASDFTAGTLTKSITSKVINSLSVAVFVALNKGAGDYAYKIHNERGTSWLNLGVGSLAKKSGKNRVGGWFIERGIRDLNRKGRIVAHLDKAVRRLIKDLER